jgi:DNA-binding transcriptional MerR regulator
VMTIGQFAHASGLSAKALRFYGEKGLLIPDEVDEVTGYRRYAPAQLRRAAMIRVLRRMGMSLPQVGEVLDNPDRCDELVARHRDEVATRYAAQEEAIALGRATLAGYDKPFPVETRTAPAQPWVAAVLDVEPGAPQTEGESARYNAAFAALALALQAAGNAPAGPFWTTFHAGDDGFDGQLLLCWPVSQPVGPDFTVDGLRLRHGVLPERREAVVRLSFDDPLVAGDPSPDPAPHPGLLALMEHLDEAGRAGGDEVRQVGVLDEDGTPCAVDITVTTGPIA